MAKMKDIKGVVQKELKVFYILDTSGSMEGAPIAALNDAMRDTVKELAKLNGDTGDANFKIAVLEFNTNARWVTNGVEDVEDYQWITLQEDGMTYLGKALTELNNALSRNTMMASETGNKAPVIIFMSDGYPNDKESVWTGELQKLQDNKWYQQATKIAFALGDDADTGVLAKVVGDPKAVIQTSNLEAFKGLIRIASVTASLAASKSKTTTSAMTGADVVDQATGGAGDTDSNGATVVNDFEDVDIDIYDDTPSDIDDMDDFS